MAVKESKIRVKETPEVETPKAYDPLPSIWSGEDSELGSLLL